MPALQWFRPPSKIHRGDINKTHFFLKGWGGEGTHARVLNIEGDMSPRSLLKSTPMHTTDIDLAFLCQISYSS